MSATINWRTIGEDDFNRLAEALIVRDRTKPGFMAQAVDGRGGDGGIDIDVRVSRSLQIVEILQLKWFPEGMSNGFKSRRTQVKDSFEAAMLKERPPVWTLVMPAKITPNERRSVWALVKGRKVRIQFIGTTELDLMLSQQPEVHEWFTRDALREALAVVGREQAALTKPGDLAAEVQRLTRRADGASPYWGRNITHRGGVYTEELYAKRADAQDREPLSVTVETSFGPEDAALRKSFEEAVKFGASQHIVLPENVVKSITKVGPEWFAETGLRGEIHFRPTDDSLRNSSATVTALDVNGRPLVSLSGQITRQVAGTEGGTIHCSLSGGIYQVWRIPQSLSTAGQLNFRFDPAGYSGRDIGRALNFLNAMRHTALLRLTNEGQSGTISIAEVGRTIELEPVIRELVDDLTFIEDSLNVTFSFPESFPQPLERIWTRTIRRMLEGRCVVAPDTDGLDITLNGELDTGLQTLLTEGCAMIISNEPWSVDLLGTEIFLDDMRLYHPRVIVDDGLEIFRMLTNGQGAGRKAHIRPAVALPFIIYSPSRLPADGSIVVPWGLQGLPEHKNFTKISPFQPLNLAEVQS